MKQPLSDQPTENRRNWFVKQKELVYKATTLRPAKEKQKELVYKATTLRPAKEKQKELVYKATTFKTSQRKTEGTGV